MSTDAHTDTAPIIEVRGVSFEYAGSDRGPSLVEVSVSVRPGEVVVVTGGSGSGKSSLLRLINGLIPHYHPGSTTGTVAVAGVDAAHAPLYETARHVGSVFQNPKTQFFAVETDSELAFGPENLGVPPPEILARIDRTTERFGMEELRGRNIFRLSGGQKQRLACASVDVQGPEVVVLDEPSANLDQQTIELLARIIARWKQDGKTVVVAEHRLAYLTGLADRFLIMRDGRIIDDLAADAFTALDDSELRTLGLRPLQATVIESLPLGPLRDNPGDDDETENERGSLEIDGFRLQHRSADQPILDVPHAVLPAGEIIAVTGPNGAGKTTFARVLAGLERRGAGVLTMGGRTLKRRARLGVCAMVMQDVNHQLFTDAVLDEVLLSMPSPDEAAARGLLDTLGLSGLEGVHPLALSSGQKQRLAVASALASEKPIVVLDEPTSGLDHQHMLAVADLLRTLQVQGRTVLVITHDPELIREACTWRVRLDAGTLDGGRTPRLLPAPISSPGGER
ncbi:ABC transporter ATP-binding protein [Microbacterium gubbeenense]